MAEMGLLKDLQKDLLDNEDLGPILLKLRFLAAKLGSDPLAAWVKYESEGYAAEADLPEYRSIGVSYSANFSGPFGTGIQNAPIPPYLIEQIAGKNWNKFSVRQSISGIEHIQKSHKDESVLKIDSSNLMLLLQGKVYKEYSCISVTGKIAAASLYEIKNTVRSRILELTLELEKTVPSADLITISGSDSNKGDYQVSSVNNITNQVVYGNMTTVSSSGDSVSISVNVASGDRIGMISNLKNAGILENDAIDFADIVASELPDSNDSPFGVKAKHWLSENLKKAFDGTWQVGIAVASQVLSEAAARYYGLK